MGAYEFVCLHGTVTEGQTRILGERVNLVLLNLQFRVRQG